MFLEKPAAVTKEMGASQKIDLHLHFLEHTRNYVLAHHTLIRNLLF
jgi:hypothetical protein